MNYAIDPDVFIASFSELPCEYALSQLSIEASSHTFYRDREGRLELEYRRIFSENYDTALFEHPALRLLQQILIEDGNPEDTLSSVNPVVDKLRQFCPEPVEPELLGMLANASRFGLSLVLVGHDAPYIRQRGLHKPDVRWTIRRQIPWLNITMAANTKLLLTQVKYMEYGVDGEVIENAPEIKAKEDAFDAKVAIWLLDQDSSFRCTTPPSEKECGEQIDVFGHRLLDNNTQTTVIGECKLRRRGNESKHIESKEVQQLLRKLKAAQRFAKRNYEPRQSPPLKFEGILISNATGIDEWARELILSESEFNIRVLSVSLDSDWETSQQWGIVSGQWLEIGPSNAMP